MFTTVLTLHILAAVAMGISAILTLRGVWRNDLPSVKRQSTLLSWGLGFELASGSALTVLSLNDVSFASFCQNVAFYLFATGGILSIAYFRIKEAFPSAAVLVPVLPGIFISTIAAIRLW